GGAYRYAAPIRAEDGGAGRTQGQSVHRPGAEGQVRVRAAAVRTGLRADVRGARGHREAAWRNRVLDGERQSERIAGLRMQRVLHHDAAVVPRPHRPGDPTDEPVDCVAGLSLVEWQVMSPAC